MCEGAYGTVCELVCEGGCNARYELCNDAEIEPVGRLLCVERVEKYLAPTPSLSSSTAAKYCKMPKRYFNSSSLHTVTNCTHMPIHTHMHVHTIADTYMQTHTHT